MAEKLERPRPVAAKPAQESRLTNVRNKRNRTTSETPKTIRLKADGKLMCAKLTGAVQDLAPSKTITDSTILRAAFYLANQARPKKLLKMVKEYL